jgi:hypothetical protein
MSEAAIDNRQLAIGEGVSASAPRALVPTSSSPSFFPIANCQLPTAHIATCCTVTFPLTSVTQLGLAESVLIGVGKLDLGCLPGLLARWILGSEAPHCSFRGDTCIQ